MFTILKEIGIMRGHDEVEIFELEELGLVAVNFNRADGTDMEAWRCDENGNALNPGEQGMRFKSVLAPVLDNQDEEPEEFELIGFELN